MKNMTLKIILLAFLGISNLNFVVDVERKKTNLFGPWFYSDNSSSGVAPEINHIVINNGSYPVTFYTTCGCNEFIGQLSGSNFTVTVVVENDWSGSTASVGIRGYNGGIIECKPYVYGTGTYTFNVSTNSGDVWFQIYTSPDIC